MQSGERLVVRGCSGSDVTPYTLLEPGVSVSAAPTFLFSVVQCKDLKKYVHI